MLVRVFTLSFSSVLGGFDDDEVREFVKDKEVLAVRDHFFLKDESPHLVLVVTYNLLRPEQEIPTRKTQVKEGGRDREAWRKTLEEADWALVQHPQRLAQRTGKGRRHPALRHLHKSATR